MASTNLALLAISVLLLQASWCVVAEEVSAVMAVTSFAQGNGNGPVQCDTTYHSDNEMVAAVATQWWNTGMCHKHIRITNPQNGQNLVAEVVDQCDIKSGCKDNMIATTKGVWDTLGLDTDIGEVPVTWSVAS